jgi:type I restriction enzyme S subunit
LGKESPSRARQVILTNDVIVSTTRPNLNAVALVPKELNNQICSTGFCVLRAKSNLLDTNYLFHFVKSYKFVKSLSDLVKGALYPAVTNKQVFAQNIPLPPLPEQKRLATLLTEKLADVEHLQKTLEEQLQAINLMPCAILRQAFNGEL